jgi:hypothetical protein
MTQRSSLRATASSWVRPTLHPMSGAHLTCPHAQAAQRRAGRTMPGAVVKRACTLDRRPRSTGGRKSAGRP